MTNLLLQRQASRADRYINRIFHLFSPFIPFVGSSSHHLLRLAIGKDFLRTAIAIRKQTATKSVTQIDLFHSFAHCLTFKFKLQLYARVRYIGRLGSYEHTILSLQVDQEMARESNCGKFRRGTYTFQSLSRPEIIHSSAVVPHI